MNRFSPNFRFWLPALGWLGVIAIESFCLSSNVTGGWIQKVLAILHIRLSQEAFETFHHILHKGGHVAGYGILCLFLFRAWYHTLLNSRGSRLRLRCAIPALGITLATAILDEWHQSFDPTRTSSIRDVGLDFTGGIIFLLAALFIFRLWRGTTSGELVSA